MTTLTIPEARALRDGTDGPDLVSARDKLAAFIADDHFLPAVFEAVRKAFHSASMAQHPGVIFCHHGSTADPNHKERPHDPAAFVLVSEVDGEPWWPHVVCPKHAARTTDHYGRPTRRYPLEEMVDLMGDSA